MQESRPGSRTAGVEVIDFTVCESVVFHIQAKVDVFKLIIAAGGNLSRVECGILGGNFDKFQFTPPS
jgi:hypothetical protein